MPPLPMPSLPVPLFSVLAIDDDPSVLQLLTLLVEDDPRLVLAGTAGDGQTAVELARHSCPDAIICDVRMPVMDGLHALPLLRQACPRSIVVMYSSDPDAATPALQLGADAVLDKTTDPRLLLDRLVDLCAGGSS